MKFVALAVLILAAGLVDASSAMARETTCAGVITGLHDNVVVPPGANCVIFGGEVFGNVKALEDSTITIIDSTVRGNVEGDKAEIVDIFELGGESVVGGNIQAKEGNSYVRVCGTEMPGGNILVQKFGPNGFVLLGGAFCQNLGGGNTVAKGNINVEDNVIGALAPFGLEIADNTIGHNLQVFKNEGPGAKRVQQNTARQVQCKENAPPFLGGPNVAPKKEGQCF
jgi:hypothetical protein